MDDYLREHGTATRAELYAAAWRYVPTSTALRAHDTHVRYLRTKNPQYQPRAEDVLPSSIRYVLRKTIRNAMRYGKWTFDGERYGLPE